MLCAYFDVKPHPKPRTNTKPRPSDPSVKVHATFVPLAPERQPKPSMAAARSTGAPLDEEEPLPGFDGEYYYCNEEDEDLRNIDDELDRDENDDDVPEDDSVTTRTFDDTSSLEDDLKWPRKSGGGAALYSGPELFFEDDEFID